MDKKNVQLKQEQVNQLTESFKNAKAIISFNYHGLSVDKITELRHELRKNGSVLKVYKNNIARRAAVKAGYEDFANTFAGPQAVITNENDVVSPAKSLFNYIKDNKDLAVDVTSGVIDGKIVGVDTLKELSQLPSYETLLTMLAGGMLQPLKDLAVGLNMYIENNQEA